MKIAQEDVYQKLASAISARHSVKIATRDAHKERKRMDVRRSAKSASAAPLNLVKDGNAPLITDLV